MFVESAKGPLAGLWNSPIVRDASSAAGRLRSTRLRVCGDEMPRRSFAGARSTLTSVGIACGSMVVDGEA